MTSLPSRSFVLPFAFEINNLNLLSSPTRRSSDLIHRLITVAAVVIDDVDAPDSNARAVIGSRGEDECARVSAVNEVAETDCTIIQIVGPPNKRFGISAQSVRDVGDVVAQVNKFRG